MSSYPDAVIGLSGLKTARTLTHRDPLWSSQGLELIPGALVIDGTKSRDAQNTGDLGCLRGGLLMGKVTSGGKFAPSILGVVGTAYASGTSLVIEEKAADEIVRRIGSTGTFKITGPPTAGGTVRTLTATFSAVAAASGGNRTATITALTVNEVQTVNLSTAATGGSIRLLVQKPDGTTVLTPAAAWSATDATLLSNLQTALDTATGVTNGIVASAIAATDTDLGFVLTYSGTGYAGNTWALAQVHTLFTSNTGANVVRTTTGVDGRFIAGSFIQPTDGSETIRCVQGETSGACVLDGDGTSVDVEFRRPIGSGFLRVANVVNYPTDTALIAWVKAQLRAYGTWKFNDDFGT